MEIKDALRKEIFYALADGMTVFVSGMARGVDLWAAELILQIKKANPQIKLICAVPYEGFEKKWSSHWQQIYNKALVEADDVKVLYPTFSYASFQERNRWMVDHSTYIIAVYNGGKGGTYNTLKYAEMCGIKARIISG